MKQENLIKEVLKDMPCWLSSTLLLLVIVFYGLMIWACFQPSKETEQQTIVNCNLMVDSVLIASTINTHDSILKLNEEVLELRRRNESLQKELNKYKQAQSQNVRKTIRK